MATLLKTKRRITSISSTRKITNAMELVASVKLKRYKNVMSGTTNYVNNIRDVLSYLFINRSHKNDPIMNKISDKRLFIVINSNLGLCASYNADVFKFTSELLTKDDEIIPIGVKGYTHYKNLNLNVNEEYVSLNEKINFDDVNKFSAFIMNLFLKKKYKSIHIVFTEYVNTITFKPKIIQLLPIENLGNKKMNLLSPIIEPNADILFDQLLPIYLATEIYQAIITSQVSEQASRRNAMENATDNADEMLDKLKLEYNKARQGAITQEISEVVSGANNVN